MPQTTDVNLAAERQKLQLIADSLTAQKDAQREWLATAWRKLYDRADALFTRKRTAKGRSASLALLDRIEEVLDELDPDWEQSLGAEAHKRRCDRWIYGDFSPLDLVDDDEYDEYDGGPIVPDDPHAPAAPPPLVVIRPNSSPPNRYGGGRPSAPGDSIALKWMFGEGKLSNQAPVVNAVRTGAPTGRPKPRD